MKTAIIGICAILACAALWLFMPGSESGDDLVPAAHETLAQSRQVTAKFQNSLISAARGFLGQAREVSRRLGDLKPAQALIEPELPGVVQGKVEKGDTIASLLDKAGMGPAKKFANAAANALNRKHFKAGQPYAIFTDPSTGHIRRFEYEVSDSRRLVVEGENSPQARLEDIEYTTVLESCEGVISDSRRLVVEGENSPQARLEDIEYTTVLESCEGVIEDSLFQAIADIGENPALALKLVELFGSEINFIRDLQDGDSFQALIEKRYREGEYRGYGRILAARFTNRGKTYEAWMFRDPEGNLNYYNSKGENLKKTLLMAPLAVTRLTSKFTHTRKHPILGGIKPHLGVDYAAPTGTPVKAVGAGTVTRRGWNGGYGNQIVVRHSGGLESMYAHLSGYAPGIRVGQKVKQGQVIGFVGSTGLSTGPHLDFRLRQGEKFINPAKAINPRGASVDAALMGAFRKTRDLEKSYLEGKKTPAKYTLDSIVPGHVSLPKSRAMKEPRRYTKRQLMLLKSIEAQKRMAHKRLKEMEQKYKKRKRG